MTQEEKYELHIKMLSKSFHREKDDLTSILLGDAVTTAVEYIEARLEELELFKSEHLRLEAELNQILHPNGDGPTNPSFCDLVAYVQSNLKRGGYLPEGVSINQVVGELHHDHVIPKAMWDRFEPLEVNSETVEKLKAQLSELPIIPMGITPIMEPTCDGCKHDDGDFETWPCSNCSNRFKLRYESREV